MRNRVKLLLPVTGSLNSFTRRVSRTFKAAKEKRRIRPLTDLVFTPIVERKVPYTNIQFGSRCIYAYLLLDHSNSVMQEIAVPWEKEEVGRGS